MQTKLKNPQKILVGGGAGFIGSVLVPKLIEQGHSVEVIDLCWFGNKLPKEVKLTKKDLFDCVEDDFKGFDQFIFLAGISNDPMAEHSPSKNFIYNGALPPYLAYLAKRAKVKRFIIASTCSIYGFTHNKAYNEKAPAVSDYPYGISKLQGEKGVLQLQDKNFSVISLRQGTVCGYSPRIRIDVVVNAMFKSAMTDNKIIINNPKIWRPIYGIQDCLQGYSLAVKAPMNVNGIFNIASKNYTVQEIANIVREILKELTGKKIIFKINHFQDSRNYKISWEKAKRELGFKPKHFIEDIVKDLYRHKEDIGDLNQDNYYNIRVFKKIVKREELRKQKLAEIEKFKY